MTTSRLPINVIQTKDAEQFYEEALEKKSQLGVSHLFCYILSGKINFLKVPQNHINGHLQELPEVFVDQLLKFLE